MAECLTWAVLKSVDDIRSVAGGGRVAGVLGVALRVELDLGGSHRGGSCLGLWLSIPEL